MNKIVAGGWSEEGMNHLYYQNEAGDRHCRFYIFTDTLFQYSTDSHNASELFQPVTFQMGLLF